MWETLRSEGLHKAAGTQFEMTFIGIQQATVAQWVALRPLFTVYSGEKGYDGVGRRRKA